MGNKLTPFKIICHTAQFDSFQDHTKLYTVKIGKIDSLQDHLGKENHNMTHCSTVKETFPLLSRPSMRNQGHTEHRTPGQIIVHLHCTIEGTLSFHIVILVTFKIPFKTILNGIFKLHKSYIAV